MPNEKTDNQVNIPMNRDGFPGEWKYYTASHPQVALNDMPFCGTSSTPTGRHKFIGIGPLHKHETVDGVQYCVTLVGLYCCHCLCHAYSEFQRAERYCGVGQEQNTIDPSGRVRVQ